MSDTPIGKLSETSSIAKLWKNGQSIYQVRESMLNGQWDEGCKNCQSKESRGLKSKRIHWRSLKATGEVWQKQEVFNKIPEKIYYLDIAFNNFCNFKCRMCSSSYSSQWVKDEMELKKMGIMGGSGGLWVKEANLAENHFNSLSDEEIHQILSMSREVKRIDILGGEPFLSKEFVRFFQLCREYGIGPKTELTITTNGSVYAEEILDLLTDFKFVNINISVDGTGEYFEYIRSSETMSFTELESNIQKFSDYCQNRNQIDPKKLWKINLNGALQIYNMLNIYDFFSWICKTFAWQGQDIKENSKFRFSWEHRILIGPKHLSVIHAPRALLNEALRQIRKVKSDFPYFSEIAERAYIEDIERTLENAIHELKPRREKFWDVFCWYTKALDKIRSQSLERLHPLLHEHYKKTLEDPGFYGRIKAYREHEEDLAKTQNSFCSMPWEAVTITGQGDVKPCCQYRDKHKNLYKENEKSIGDLYNSNQLRDLRQEFLNYQKPKGCVSCWEREDQIGHSRRTWFKEKFVPYSRVPPTYTDQVENPQWKQMDINLSNLCNLKCRMCGSWGSDKWIEDEVALAVNDNPFYRETNPNKLKKYELGLDRLAELIPHMKQIERIDFKGGEPMLAKNHPAFLQMLIDEKINQKVTLHYTTNGTLVNPKILQLLPKFKNVNMVFSIEGTDPLYSYIRGGSNHKTMDLIYNLRIYDQLPNIKIMSNVAIQAYNLVNLYPLYYFIHNLPIKNLSAKEAFRCIVNSPDYLSPFVWPQELRNEVAHQLEHIDEFDHFREQLLKKKFDQALFRKFLEFTDKLDEIRNENYFKIFPDLEKYR